MRVMFLNYHGMAVRSPKILTPLKPFAQGSFAHRSCSHRVRSPLFSVEKNSTVVYNEYVDDTL